MLLPVLFLFLGYGRMMGESARLLSFDTAIQEMKGTAKLSGKVKQILDRKDGAVLTVSDIQLYGKRKYGKDLGILVYLDGDGAAQMLREGICPGMTVKVQGSLEPFAKARNPGEFNFALYYRSLKLNGRMFGENIKAYGASYSPYLGLLWRIRRYGERCLERVSDPGDEGIFKAAILGVKDSLDAEVRDLYQKNGIAHLLAISGLHLSIVGMAVYRLLRKIGAGYGAAGIGGTVLIVSYGILTGGSSSVVRAVMMLLSGFLAEYLGRTYDLLSAMYLSLLLLSWSAPYLLTQGGFQLSFGAIASIGLAAPCLENWIEPKSAFGKTVIMSVSIQLVTAPVILYHFFQLPLYGLILNLLVIPLMSIVICSGIGGIALCNVWAAAGNAAIGSGHYVLMLFDRLCRWFSLLPHYSLILGRPGWKQILIYYSIMCCFLWAGGRVKRKKEIRICRTARWISLSLLAGICIWILSPVPVSGLEVTFLDVGQGDGIVLRTRNQTILVDGGSSSEKELGEYRLEPFLKSKGISRISYAFVSHGDSDHISGLVYLLTSCPDLHVDHLVLSCLGKGDKADDKLRELMKEQGGEVWELAKGDQLKLGDLTLNCIYPGREDPYEDRNEQSEVIKVGFGKFHLLLTGDMSEDGEKRILEEQNKTGFNLKDIQVLKVAHHGSITASSQAFLEAVAPKWAVISYEEGNSYGHPHKEVVDRLKALGVRIFGTGENGAVTLKTDGVKISWKLYCY